jgi:phytoene dehydrogenase-like protein
MEEFDAVVVGAGNGGLTASTALAGKDLKLSQPTGINYYR